MSTRSRFVYSMPASTAGTNGIDVMHPVRLRRVGPDAKRRYGRVSGALAGSGRGSRPARTRRPFSSAVTPDLIRGPEPQAPPSPGLPGPRIKSGVTKQEGRRLVSLIGAEPGPGV